MIEAGGARRQPEDGLTVVVVVVVEPEVRGEG